MDVVTAAFNDTHGDDDEDAAITPLVKLFAVLMSICIAVTIVGNVLVVLSVFTYRPLRAVQNFYIVSLAVADLAVAILVMPFNVAVSTVGGRWSFGWVWCHVWLTCDILTCTASILNLCAIAVDRYFAVHDPISYGRQRTVGRVLVAVALVWIVSAVISIPPLPLFGRTETVNETETEASSRSSRLYNDHKKVCQLSDETAYVIYSASGSFFIPLIVMIFVYVNIYAATRARLRARAAADGRLAAAIITTSAAPLKPELARKSLAATVIDAMKAAAEKRNGQCAADTTTTRPANENDKNVEDGEERHSPDGEAPDIARTAPRGVEEANDAAPPATKSEVGGASSPHAAVAAPAAAGDVVVVSEGDDESGSRHCCFRPHRRLTSILRRFKTDNGDAEFDDDDDIGDDMVAADSPRSPRSAAGTARRSRRATSSAFTTAMTSTATTSCKQGSMAAGSAGQRIWQVLEAKQRISLARERRAARTMGFVMGAFVLCWLPFFVVYVVFAFRKDWKDAVDPNVYNFIVWLGYINSTLNPLIYTVFNVDFRRAFALLLRCRCFRRRRPGGK